MTIDIRQEIICSAGPLISATILDDYMSMSGLITTRGECQIVGLSSADLGDSVTFTGVNRSLRVTGKSYSPLDNVTTLQLGCLLTLNAQAQDMDFKSRVEETDVVIPEWWGTILEIPTEPVSSIVQRCGYGMNLPGAATPAGLDKVFIDNVAEEYELTSTYSSTLAAIYAAYSSYGHISGGSVVASHKILSAAGGGVRLLTEQNLIATGPSGVGSIPPNRIKVNYTYRGVKKLTREARTPREVCSESSTEAETRFVYYNFDTDVTDPDNDPEERSIEYTYAPTTRTCSYFDNKNQEYLTVETATGTGVLDNYAANLGAAGFTGAATAAATRSCTQVTETAREFDIAGHVIREVVEVTQEVAVLGSSLNLPYARPEELQSDGSTTRPAVLVYSLPGAASTFVAERVERITEVVFLDVRLRTRRWVAAGYTPEGQQAAAEGGKDTRNGSRIGAILSQAQRLIEQPEEVQTLRNAAKQWTSEITAAEQAEELGADASKTTLYGITSSASEVVVVGDLNGLGGASLSLPFVPDSDMVIAEITEASDGTTSIRERTSIPPFDMLAREYAYAYRQLNMAMRYAINVQVPLSLAPATVAQSYQLRLRGTVGAYISTGASFQLSAEGGICSMDLLYLGGIGSSSGDFWVPAVGPLPPLPPTMTDPVTGDTVYDLTDVILVPAQNPPALQTEGGIRLGVEAFSITGPAVTTKVAEVGLALGSDCRSVIGVSGVAVTVTAGFEPGEATTDSDAGAPGVELTVSVALTSGSATADSSVPSAVQTVSVAFAAGAASESDPYFANVILLLHMDGADGSTTFTDSSVNGLTVSRVGSPVISTAQSLFGGASGLFNGSSDFLTVSSSLARLSSGDHTVEFAMRAAALPTTGNTAYLWNQYYAATAPAGRCMIYLRSDGMVSVQLGSSVATSTTVLTVGQWYRIAYTRAGSTNRLYVDGLEEASFTSSQTILNTNVRIGASNQGSVGTPSYSFYFNGHIDELRVTNGVARYTAASYTLPTSAFPDS